MPRWDSFSKVEAAYPRSASPRQRPRIIAKDMISSRGAGLECQLPEASPVMDCSGSGLDLNGPLGLRRTIGGVIVLMLLLDTKRPFSYIFIISYFLLTLLG